MGEESNHDEFDIDISGYLNDEDMNNSVAALLDKDNFIEDDGAFGENDDDEDYDKIMGMLDIDKYNEDRRGSDTSGSKTRPLPATVEKDQAEKKGIVREHSSGILEEEANLPNMRTMKTFFLDDKDKAGGGGGSNTLTAGAFIKRKFPGPAGILPDFEKTAEDCGGGGGGQENRKRGFSWADCFGGSTGGMSKELNEYISKCKRILSDPGIAGEYVVPCGNMQDRTSSPITSDSSSCCTSSFRDRSDGGVQRMYRKGKEIRDLNRIKSDKLGEKIDNAAWKSMQTVFGLNLMDPDGIQSHMNIKWVKTHFKAFPTSMKIPFLTLVVKRGGGRDSETGLIWKDHQNCIRVMDHTGLISAAVDVDFMESFGQLLPDGMGATIAVQNCCVLTSGNSVILIIAKRNVACLTTKKEPKKFDKDDLVYQDKANNNGVWIMKRFELDAEAVVKDYFAIVEKLEQIFVVKGKGKAVVENRKEEEVKSQMIIIGKTVVVECNQQGKKEAAAVAVPVEKNNCFPSPTADGNAEKGVASSSENNNEIEMNNDDFGWSASFEGDDDDDDDAVFLQVIESMDLDD